LAQEPAASLTVTPSSGIVPLTVNASTAASTDPDGSIVFRSIAFGDGAAINNATTSHTYKYIVTATLTDDLSPKAM
jgi:PKD repeat protein